MPGIDAFNHVPRIAYFSMEIALRNDIPTYAGGLGVLAGDMLRSAADLEVPMEASGTSGMKAAFNGVPQLSVLDGWWIEGCIEGITGWAIDDDASSDNGDDARHLYQKLEEIILPLYYQDRSGWTSVMKGAIAKCASFFNSQRMMRRYASEEYVQ